jgi:hypothetical protein
LHDQAIRVRDQLAFADPSDAGVTADVGRMEGNPAATGDDDRKHVNISTAGVHGETGLTPVFSPRRERWRSTSAVARSGRNLGASPNLL